MSRVIFLPDDYWTNPPEEICNMSHHPNARDIRLAAVLTKHHRQQHIDGMVEIARTAYEQGRAAQLLHSVLHLHHIYIGMTRTSKGIDALALHIRDMANVDPTNPGQLDIQRACLVLDAYGRNDYDGINTVLRAANADDRATELLITLLNVYGLELPELTSNAGIRWIDTAVSVALGEEAADEERREGDE